MKMKYEIYGCVQFKINLGSTDVLDIIIVFSAAKLPIASMTHSSN